MKQRVPAHSLRSQRRRTSRYNFVTTAPHVSLVRHRSALRVNAELANDCSRESATTQRACRCATATPANPERINKSPRVSRICTSRLGSEPYVVFDFAHPRHAASCLDSALGHARVRHEAAQLYHVPERFHMDGGRVQSLFLQ